MDDVLDSKAGRLAKHARCAWDRFDISISSRAFWVGETQMRMTQDWPHVKRRILQHARKRLFAKLADRRPTYYGALTLLSVRRQSSLLTRLPPLEAKTLLKIWSGGIITGHKRARKGLRTPLVDAGMRILHCGTSHGVVL